VWLREIDRIGAGQVSARRLDKGETVRIMTGAPIPDGADAVVPLELVRERENGNGDERRIGITRRFQPGDNISRRGEDIPEGAVLLNKGRRIAAGEMALLATFGCTHVHVFARPTVGVFATGNELLTPSEPLAPGKIRDSNSYMLLAQIREAGAKARLYGILPDDFELCLSRVEQALAETDVLLVTGGVSVGDYDYVQKILNELECDVLFNKVAMRPGSVTTAAVKGNKWLFGLSGNPSACFVGFELFVRPLLMTMLGAEAPFRPWSKAKLTHDIRKANPFTRFIRARIDIAESQITVRKVGLDKSGAVSSLAEANGLIVAPGGTKGLAAGDMVDVMWLGQPAGGLRHGF
jgi:molybdopterin molybdotransferase